MTDRPPDALPVDETIVPSMVNDTIQPDQAPATVADDGAAAAAQRVRPSPLGAVRHTAGGVGAVGVKELRGRMRGRRAFVILTIYLVLLGGFAWMVELIMERTYSSGFGGSAAFASAQIGQVIFAALLILETLQVVFLAPAATAGAISLEREKRTLELLVVTPISSLAIVLGKLLSALIYVWLLIAASIPLTAVVFVYGGVAPEDVLRGYLVLVVTALGFGAFGLFASSLVKRTQAATAISIFGVLFVSIGTIFLLIFWQAMASSGDGRGVGPIRGAPPPVIAYLNPFLAQVDVLCGTETSSGGWCGIGSQFAPNPNGVIFVTGDGTGPVSQPQPAPGVDIGPDGVFIDPNVGVKGGIIGGGREVAPPDGEPFGVVRDAFWPKSVATWLILSVVFLFASVQFVSPTRRWRPRRGRRIPEAGN
jgi:ABC-type transport system involved in multi-copper enzyme maturation permease subunit